MLIGILASFWGFIFGERINRGSVSTAEGFVDINLPIVKSEKAVSGLVSVVARGEIDGRIVGFAVDVDPNWKAKPTDDGKVVFYWGSARIKSIGKESDNFVRLLAELYKSPKPSSVMPPKIEVEAVGLANDPSRVFESPTKMKFFFASNSEESYAEVFLNLDVPGKKLEFHEKDQEYRGPLLRAFQSSKAAP